jgi:hypothetical protein
MSAGSGKLYDANDNIFDETALLESQSQINQGSLNCVSEGTLIVANSPLVVDVAAVVLKNGVNGYITNDSTSALPRSFTVAISHNGSTYDTAFTLEQGETFSLFGRNVSKIKLTRLLADCAYRLQSY